MTSWTVSIPGLPPFTSIASDRDAALVEGLDHYGLHFAPDGTTVEPADAASAA